MITITPEWKSYDDEPYYDVDIEAHELWGRSNLPLNITIDGRERQVTVQQLIDFVEKEGME